MIDIFREGNIETYINYCKAPRAAWTYMEEPMWKIILNKMDLSKAAILDVGTGTGVIWELLVQMGAKPDDVFALEPNPELVNYLYKEKGIHCIWDSTNDLGNEIMQQGEFDLITANMVINHLNTEEYDNFILYAKGVLMPDGFLIYTIPYREETSKKDGVGCVDDNVVVEEEAPWGGTVKYHHRSQEYQVGILEKMGFEVKRIRWGYEDFVSKEIIESGEIVTGKNLRGSRRLMFVARKT